MAVTREVYDLLKENKLLPMDVFIDEVLGLGRMYQGYVEPTTGIPWLDRLKELGEDALPATPVAKEYERQWMNVAWQTSFGIVARRYAENVARIEGRTLSEEDVKRFQGHARAMFQKLADGVSPEQVVSDFRNNVGDLGEEGDHSSDDADAQRAWTAGGDADAEPYPASEKENKKGSTEARPGLEDLPFLPAPADPRFAPGSDAAPAPDPLAESSTEPSGGPADGPTSDAGPEGAAPDRRSAAAAQSWLRPEEQAQLAALIAEVDAAGAASAEAAMLKPSETWTEAEMQAVMREAAYWANPDGRASPERAAVTRWFDHVYTTAPVRRDATGRMRQPEPLRPAPQTPQPAREPDGRDLRGGLAQIAQALAGAAGTLGYPGAVRGLQRGLARLDPSERPGAAPPKIDGDFGPKTRRAVRRAAARHGRAAVAGGLALGGIEEEAAAARRDRGGAEVGRETGARLQAWAAAAQRIADAGRPAASSGGDGAASALGRRLQGGLNGLLEDEGLPRLAEDGVLGPRSGAAFRELARRRRPGEVAGRLSARLGLLR